MEKKSKFVLSSISGILFIVLIVLVRCVDVASIGPEGTAIGLSHLNKAVFDLFGVNMGWYKITEFFGILAILTALLFAFAGFIQLIKRKSVFKVDKEILELGSLYILVGILYVLFEIIIVNYRPVIMPDAQGVEASFPSSHTMLICTIMGSTMMFIGRYIKKKEICRIVQVICCLIMVTTVIGRLLSGVHWFTDILGGVLISIALLSLLSGIKDILK